MARLHSLQGHDVKLPRKLERERCDRATRWTLGHEFRYGLVRSNDEEELALVLAFVRVVGEHESVCLDHGIAEPPSAHRSPSPMPAAGWRGRERLTGTD